MKTSAIGMVSAAILILVAGVGFGIAQAGGNQPYDPMLTFGDQDVPPSSDVGQAPEFCPEDCFAAPIGRQGSGRDRRDSGDGPEEDMYRGWGPNEWDITNREISIVPDETG